MSLGKNRRACETRVLRRVAGLCFTHSVFHAYNFFRTTRSLWLFKSITTAYRHAKLTQKHRRGIHFSSLTCCLFPKTEISETYFPICPGIIRSPTQDRTCFRQIIRSFSSPHLPSALHSFRKLALKQDPFTSALLLSGSCFSQPTYCQKY